MKLVYICGIKIRNKKMPRRKPWHEKSARRGARGPGDLGFAPTEAERRHRTFESGIGLEKTKRAIPFGITRLFLKARDGDRTRDPLLGKEVLHR